MYKKILYPIKFEKFSLDVLFCKVTTRLHVGKAGKDLREIAIHEDTSLVVMGAHGKGYVEEILWGSVSRNVVEYRLRTFCTRTARRYCPLLS